MSSRDHLPLFGNCLHKIKFKIKSTLPHSTPITQSILPTLVRRPRKGKIIIKWRHWELEQRWTRSPSPLDHFLTHLCKWTSLELLCRTVWIYKIMSLPLLRGCAEEESALWWHEELLAEEWIGREIKYLLYKLSPRLQRTGASLAITPPGQTGYTHGTPNAPNVLSLYLTCFSLPPWNFLTT